MRCGVVDRRRKYRQAPLESKDYDCSGLLEQLKLNGQILLRILTEVIDQFDAFRG